ncbi:type 1 periplasmic-binding domain-containing protein [Paraburkholderia bannensis]|uniref:hypothetical protein n=1 Tax=Paraburkholderia bannensis TaxID=765414 RepID=UPI002AB6596A|nr:hypothetical protein [Paraburkholderia bannensis]
MSDSATGRGERSMLERVSLKSRWKRASVSRHRVLNERGSVSESDSERVLPDVRHGLIPIDLYRAVSRALMQGDLAGIYISGYGSAGIAATFREFGAAEEVVWIGHEIVDEHRTFIEEGRWIS